MNFNTEPQNINDLPENYSQIYNTSLIEQLPDRTNQINDDQVNKDVLREYGGITLSILIVISAIIFMILFYDSLCVEEAINLKI